MTTAVVLPSVEEETLSLETVRLILSDAVDTLDELADQPVPNFKRPEGAATSRVLLNLADNLSLASNLVRNEYWAMRGLTAYDVV